VTDQPPPFPQGPTPVGLLIAHPKQTKTLTRILFQHRPKPKLHKTKTHKRKPDDWQKPFDYH
jgi:hypothetical protein